MEKDKSNVSMPSGVGRLRHQEDELIHDSRVNEYGNHDNKSKLRWPGRSEKEKKNITADTNVIVNAYGSDSYYSRKALEYADEYGNLIITNINKTEIRHSKTLRMKPSLIDKIMSRIDASEYEVVEVTSSPMSEIMEKYHIHDKSDYLIVDMAEIMDSEYLLTRDHAFFREDYVGGHAVPIEPSDFIDDTKREDKKHKYEEKMKLMENKG